MKQKKTNLTQEEKAAKAVVKEAARKATKEKLASDNKTAKKKLNKETLELIENAARNVVRKVCKKEIESLAQIKLERLMLQIPDAIGGVRVHDKVYCRFSCEQLLAIFGGWFTLNYAFSTKYQNTDGTESETDFYVCSQDVSGLRKNERPPLNTPLHKAFGVEVYGFAIIAPSTAFM